MQYLPNILFSIALVAGIGYFTLNIRKIIRNIKLGQEVDASDNTGQRWSNVVRIALGQSKMVVRPIPGLLHLFVYIGFVIINIEVLEIIIDGIFGTHRVLSTILPEVLYNFLIGSFEILALLVLVGVILFWTRRNIQKLQRFWKPEMKGWPKNDGNFILYFEMALMLLFLTMNAADQSLQALGAAHYVEAGAFPISRFIVPLMDGFSEATLMAIERSAWWLHILGILVFLNYLYFSKHLHILLAFPNVYFGSVTPKGKFKNLGLLYLNWMEVLDLSLVSLNPTFLWPQILGGALMGVGFVIGGYCPGTSLVASATGKLDGMIYVAGALFGMLLYSVAYPAFQGFAESGSLGEVTLSDWLNLRPGVVAFLVVLMALGMFYGAEWLEKKFQPQPAAAAAGGERREQSAAALQLEQTI